ncbi:MAG TPA: alpha/beta hydrolase [Archangium sp.]|nr:alpha/beta hydrolase [Archangium sp.]
MTELRHRFVDAKNLRMHLVEAGPEKGPTVLLCHGFPESWYSWRHQLTALAAAGYRVVAPDMRGYGQTEARADVHAYPVLHHEGDMVGVLDALGVEKAVVVGHDWGSPVAWNAALWRPERFHAVAVLGVPWMPRTPVPMTQLLAQAVGDQWFYFLYFQQPGKAEAELDTNVRTFLRGFFYSLSGNPPYQPLRGLAGGPKNGTMLEHLLQPEVLPPWLTEQDLDFYTAEFQRTGFRGGLNWYRCADVTWELSRAWDDRRIEQPVLFIAGEREPVLAMQPGAAEAMAQTVPGLRRTLTLPGCGHWTQQERPAEVNAALLDFLAGL